MSNTDLWKYCTKDQCLEMILSFDLLKGRKWTDEKIISCLYAVGNHAERHYQPAMIPKRDGTMRRLLVPDALLKGIQRNILRHVLEEMPVSPHAFAYHRGVGIVENAAVHTGKPRILELDIKDFFGNILFYMVRQRAFGGRYFPPQVGALLTSLCCCRDCLPQGAPTSPAVSNLVMRPFDDYMGKWCGERGIAYSRYCDDLTFSGDFDTGMVRRKVSSYLRVMGFELNDRKTRVVPDTRRQTVTGIVVNEKPQVSREYRRKLRQEIYYCQKYGVSAHLSQAFGSGDKGGEAGRYLLALLGKVNFVLQANPADSRFVKARESVKKMIEEL